MGCLNSTEGKSSGDLNQSSSNYRRKLNVNPEHGRQQQGVHELKQNYVISKKSQQLGSGAFGSVFKTSNIHNPNH